MSGAKQSPGWPLIEAITSRDPLQRDLSIWDLVKDHGIEDVLGACDELDSFRRRSENLYERVRASMFLHALYRYRVQNDGGIPSTGLIPYSGCEDLMARRFEQAIAEFRKAREPGGTTSALASALAHAYEQLAYQTLADQVQRSVRSCSGNRWMFRVGSPDEHSMRIVPALLDRPSGSGPFPILIERTPVRLDLSHSAWSDIFFLGMDFPEGARVLNISVDLGVFGRDQTPSPPIESYVRVITEPVIRLTSIDLNTCKDVDSLEELFNFGNDYLGLLKAGVVASGLVPPSFEGTGAGLEALLDRIVRPSHGLEIVTKVNDIPKGSRLAVSTNLLASLISVLMRATGQARSLTGPLEPQAAQVVVARAILGEWLGGSGGGWQDSGGVFPGVKLISGAAAANGDPEWGISRGRLLPRHELFMGEPNGADPAVSAARDSTGLPAELSSEGRLPSGFADSLARSLVLVHGGMAQNVGPILNMVTEKYLLRTSTEWQGRQEAMRIFDEIVQAVRRGEIRQIGGLTTANWEGPLKSIIPWVTNRFTEEIIARGRQVLGEDFWGFLMLGGMSGGGMAFFVAPHRRESFRQEILEIMRSVKSRLDDALPFAMEPVVYDFAINSRGTHAELVMGDEALMPSRYYTLQIPRMIAAGTEEVAPLRREDLHRFAEQCEHAPELSRVFRTVVHRLFPVSKSASGSSEGLWDRDADRIRRENGFDPLQHEALRADYQKGRIDLSRNRLPVDTDIQDVHDNELLEGHQAAPSSAITRGLQALKDGQVAVVTLAAGIGSRWTTGAGVVKAVNPFALLAGRHRGFLEIHLAKTNRIVRETGATLPHVVTTSYLTHKAVQRHLEQSDNYGHAGEVLLSPGQSIAQRLVPMARSLNFLWEEMPHELLDENKQKVLDASRKAILDWVRLSGEGTDYVDNVPIQRFNPPGHFYEIPNMLRNGVLKRLLQQMPRLSWLMVHNVDTLGADVDPGLLGLAMESGASLVFEVVPRHLEDRGGGLARVNGRLRLLEGLAMPREDSEYRLRYYNSLTTWVNIDGLLKAFGLTRSDLASPGDKVPEAVRRVAARVPTYVTIKDAKRRWGHGQEDVLPVAQFEKLWGDLTSLTDLRCAFAAVSRQRGQQLKDPAQLDGWANDGSKEHIENICLFSR